ncbi:MAG: regulatory protein RecX [Clostridia bacterium]|nr:regulatory protein RecX [Clostridia bacterium]
MSKEITKGMEKAARSALNILGYADNTEKKLREKLTRKGFNEDERDFAVGYAKKMGYLNEKRHLEMAVYSLANTKLYGKKRIVQDLYVKGFKKSDIAQADFSEIDFPKNCAKRIRQTKKNYSDVNKLYIALLRYGFSGDEIKEAFKIYKTESEENE